MKMRISVLPKTSLGRWSLWLFLACVLLFVIFIALGAYVNIPTELGGVALLPGVSSFVTALIGIIKNRERSILIFLVLIVELLFLAIGVGELAQELLAS